MPGCMPCRKERDFVRLAAKCDAIICPFAAVGADDAYDIMMEVEEVLAAPLLGDLVKVRLLAVGFDQMCMSGK